MIDHVLVTVQAESIKRDMELPIKITVEELSEKLLEILRELAPDKFQEKEHIRLIFEDIVLSGSKTLEEHYVWDGSVLKVQ